MGNAVARCAGEDSDFRILCGIDRSDVPESFPVYRSFSDVHTKPDVVVDFSNPALLGDILDYCLKNSVPAVLATTGYTDAQTEKIRAAAEKSPGICSDGQTPGPRGPAFRRTGFSFCGFCADLAARSGSHPGAGPSRPGLVGRPGRPRLRRSPDAGSGPAPP